LENKYVFMSGKELNLQSKICNPKSKKGFTLVELLVVIAITIILAGAAVPIYGGLQVSGQLNETNSQIVQTLRIARQRSISRVNDATHGVYFEIDPIGDDSYTLYQGSSYATRMVGYDQVFAIDNPLSFSTTDFILTGSQDVDINFSKGFGEPDNTGTMTLTHSVSGSNSFSVNSIGKIEEN